MMKILLLIILFVTSCTSAPVNTNKTVLADTESQKLSKKQIDENKIQFSKYKLLNNFPISAKGNGFFKLICENDEEIKFQVSAKIELSKIDIEPYSSSGVFSITGPLGSDGATIKINNNELNIESANYDGIKKVIDNLLSEFKSKPSELLFAFLGRPILTEENVVKFDGIYPSNLNSNKLNIKWSSQRVQGPGLKSISKGIDIQTKDCELKFKWLDVLIN